MIKQRLEDVSVDRSRDYEKMRRACIKEHEKRENNLSQYSRTLEIAINLYKYIQDTPGMNRALLAEKLHVSQAYICNLINGKLNPSIKTIEKYEQILSISLLPKSSITDKYHIVSSLPIMRSSSTDLFVESFAAPSNFFVYANHLQILTY